MRSHRSKLALLGLLLLFSVSCARQHATGPVTAAQAQAVTLNVGLYPYVPRLDQFKQAISAAWAKAEPNVSLHYVTQWDGGYSTDPNTFSMDVYVFDAVFLDYFRGQGWLTQLSASQIANLGDFLPYAIEGVSYQGSYYAIPMLGCAQILFYRQGDTQVANATTLSQLKTALGQCTYTSKVPPDRRGLMIDMAGGTTNACLYVDAVESLDGQWPVTLSGTLDPSAVSNLQTIMTLSSFYDATTSTADPYQRAEWFGAGYGRTVSGYTESMSQMGNGLSTVDFKILPLGDDPSARPLFYSDVIGISPTTSQFPLALELANLMASTPVMVASTGATASEGPQFLMPVRPTIFQAFSSNPIYQKMNALVSSSDPILFNLGPSARTWIDSMKNTIKSAVRNDYPCGCDQPSSSPIYDQSVANQVCPTVCSSHGGWNGQWTNVPSGTSVCGCNTCPGT